MDARVNLGVAYKGLGEIDKAFAEYDTVLKADANNALAHYDLGVIFQKHKDAPDKAIEHYKAFVANSREVVPADHPVFESIRECEQYIRQMAEMKAAEERAKKDAEEQKKLEEQKKREEQDKAAAEEKAKQDAEQQRRQQEAKKVVDSAMSSGQQPAAQQPPAEQAPNGAPAPAKQEASKPDQAASPAPAAPQAAQPAAPASPEPPSDEPQGEP
jgi:tetratricopeptide (TPR) repeat protein